MTTTLENRATVSQRGLIRRPVVMEIVEPIDISTLPEEEKARLWKKYNADLLSDDLVEECDFDNVQARLEAQYPGLIKERIQHACDEGLREREQQKIAQDELAKLIKSFEHKEPTPEEIEAEWQEELAEREEERKDHLLYDPGSGKKMTYQKCKNKYGPSISARMYDADQTTNGTLNKQLWQQIMDIHRDGAKCSVGATTAKREIAATQPVVIGAATVVKNIGNGDPPIQPAKAQSIMCRERQKADGYFMRTERGVIKNEYYKEIFKEKGRSVLYEELWSNIVRHGWIDKPGYPIKKKYYDKGQLAYCTSYRHLADSCGIDKETVQGILKEFHEAGIIRLEFFVPEGKRREQMVAIIGEWSHGVNGIEEQLYRDRVFLAPKDGKCSN